MVLKRVDPLSLARISGTLYAILGLVFGAVFSVIAMLGAAARTSDSSSDMGWLFGAGAIVVLPLFYGLIGFVGALISAWLYNWLARTVGGVKLDLE